MQTSSPSTALTSIDSADLQELSSAVATAFSRHGWTLAVAESCTGGLLAASLTDLAGSSQWFERGYVTYSNAAKTACLQVSPMLIEAEGEYRFINVHRSVPQPNTTNPIQALLLAKHYGISVWDETVAKSLKMSQNSEILTSFLNESVPLSLEFDSSEKSIDQFKDLFKYNTPALIIVPGHDEFFTLKSWVLWLKEQNIDEKDMSVLFRLPNDTGSMFNDLVKSFNLNSPIGENTKIVFISQKLPKPLIKSGIEFKFIINLGSISGVHYSLSNYLQDRMDVIKYTDKKKIGYQFGLL